MPEITVNKAYQPLQLRVLSIESSFFPHEDSSLSEGCDVGY